jgi:mono/diheme cytochrome c family protein
VKGRSWVNVSLFLALVATTALCFFLPERDVTRPNYDFLPEAQMTYPVAYGSFAPNPNFPDGLTLRPPPAGTIARGESPLHYLATPEDAVRAGQELHNPFSDKEIPRRDRGSAVFGNFCQVCHGPLGQGNGPVTQGGFPPPASLLADRAVQMKDGQMFHVLTYGQGNMPSFDAQLSREDRWSVVLHVRLLQAPYAPSEASRSQEVAKLFRENCAACHGEDGTGNNIRKVLPLIPDFTSLAWQMSQTEMAIVNQIDYGTLPMMPAFRYKLPQEQILRLAVYVRSFAAHHAAGQPPLSPAAHITASNVYGTFCFACHDTSGKGNPTIRNSMPELPDFTAASWQKSRTDADLSHSILEGKGKFMLPMKDKLGSVDAKQMVELVRGFDGGKQVIPLEPPKAAGPPAPIVVTRPSTILSTTPAAQGPKVEQPLVAPTGESAARIRIGASIFRQYCIICHGPDGTGAIMRAAMPPIPDFTNPSFHQQHSDVQLLVSILDGKGTLMPANRGRVTDEQAGDLVAYVRAFGPKQFNSQRQVADSEFDKAFRQLQGQWNELEKELKKTRGEK